MMLMLMDSLSHMGTLHVNTFGQMAGGVQDITIGKGPYDCPCKQNSSTVTPPHVSTDYYYESGAHSCCPVPYYSNDPLWDGQQCDGSETSCCTQPNMPWFIKTLNETTTEDIELRLCKDNYHQGDNLLELIELYVQ